MYKEGFARVATFTAYYLPLLPIILVESQFTCSLEEAGDVYDSAINGLQLIKTERNLHELLAKVLNYFKL